MHSSCAHKFSAFWAKIVLALVTSCLLLIPATHLDAQTWVGTTTSWNTTGNWSTGVLPTAATAVTFGNPTGGNYTLTFTGAGTTLGITFTNAGTSAYNLNTSGQTLTIAGNGIVNNNAFTQTFSGTGAVTVGATQTWNAASGDLAFTVSTLNINSVLTLSGANDISVSSATSLGANLTDSGSGTDSFSGTTTLTGSRTVTNSGTGSLSFAAVNLSNSATSRTLTVSGTGDTSITGAIANGSTSTTGALTYNGTGTLTLSGANTYGGATTVSGVGGTLVATTNAGALGAGTLTLSGGALTLANDSGLNFGRNTTVSANTTITSDVLTPGNAGVTHTLGTLSIGAQTLTVNAGSNVGSGTAGLTFSGLTTLSATGTTFSVGSGALLTFAGVGTAANRSFTVTGAGDTTINGAVANGTGTLTKSGAGTLTLNGTNSGTGATTINHGTITSGLNGALSTGALTINDTAAGTSTLDLNGHNQTFASLTFGGTGTGATNNLNIGSGGTLTLGGNVTYTATNNPFGSTISAGTLALGATRSFTINDSTNAASDLTVSSVISGAGFGLTKAGAGTLTLSGLNTYTGVTSITAGTLSTSSLANGGSASNLGQSTNAATNLLISNGATLQFNGASNGSTNRAFQVGTTGATLDASGAAAFNLTNAAALTYSANNVAHTLTLTGTGTAANTLAAIVNNDGTGLTALTKSGTGTWALSGANTYTGVTTIAGGTLSVGSLANGGTASNLGQSTNVATNLVLNGGTLQYTGAAVNTNRLFSVGTSGGTIDASGSGAVNFNNAGSMGFNAQTGTRTLTLTGTNTNANTLAAIIGDNTGATSLAKTGAGEWVLSGANTYTGTTNITGGTLQIAGAANTTWLGSNAGGAVNISNGGTLDLGGVTANVVNFGAKQFNISGDGVGNNGAIVNSSTTAQTTNAFQNIALTGDATIGGGDGSSNTQSGRWDIRSGAATLDLAGNTLTKTGSNQVSVVAGTITSGNITVNQGEFAIQTSTNATGTGTFTFNDGTTLGLWSNTGSVTRDMVFNGNNIVLNEIKTGSGASTIGSNMTINGSTNFDIVTNTSLTLTGQLAAGNGAALITLNGANSTSYDGAHTYTGTLTLGANQLFNGELDLAGGTLGLAGYKLTVDTLHITGNSTIDFGSSLASILDTTNFIIDAGVTLTIANWADVTDYFYSTNNPGATALSQITFNSPYASNPTKWLTYTDGPDNNHQITPVPEPGTYGALLTAAALGFFIWQRRKARVAPLAC